MLHWEQHYSCVQENVDSGCDPTLEIDVVTFTLVKSVPLCPSVADRPALKEGGEEEGNGVSSRYTHDSVGDHLELLVWEDAEVEEENRDLGDTEGRDVEDLSIKVVSEDIGDLIVLERPYVSTEAIFDY